MSRPKREPSRSVNNSVRLPVEHREPGCGAVLFIIHCQARELPRLRREEGRAQGVVPTCPSCGAAIGAADWRFGTPEEEG